MINHRLFDHARARVQSAHLLTVNTVPSSLLAALPNVRRCHLPNGEKKNPTETLPLPPRLHLAPRQGGNTHAHYSVLLQQWR
jgi:hypothetical protein